MFYKTLLLLVTTTASLPTVTYQWEGVLIDGEAGTQIFTPNGQYHSSSASFLLPHCGLSTAIKLNNTYYFMGGTGCTNGTSGTYIFNSSTNATVKGSPTTVARAGHMVALVNDSIAICGGGSATCEQCIITQPAVPCKFAIVATLPHDLISAVMVNINDLTFIFGGQKNGDGLCVNKADVYMFDAKWNHGPQLSSMPQALAAHTGITIFGDRVLICGGRTAVDNTCQAVNTCYFYSADSDTWTTAPSMATERYGHQMVSLFGKFTIVT
jgi:N-acetylneuraminic acid mutarotase